MRPTTPTITIRTATDADARTLRRLAALDEAGPVALPALIAEQDDRAVAALSLRDGAVAADPFAPTADVLELLRLRAQRLARPTRGTRLPSIRRVRRPVSAGA